MRARLLGRRPSPATVMAAAALFVSLGGAGYAATGGTFMLGQANSAANTSGLSSGVTTGPTLNLANTGGKPAAKFTANAGVAPFVVSNGTKVASLNADKLDGIDSSGFLRNLLPVSLSGSAPGDLFDVTNSGSGVAILGSTPNGTGAGIHGTSSSGRRVEASRAASRASTATRTRTRASSARVRASTASTASATRAGPRPSP